MIALIAISRASSAPPSLRREKSTKTHERCARPGGCACTTLPCASFPFLNILPPYVSPRPVRDAYGTLYAVSLSFCLFLVGRLTYAHERVLSPFYTLTYLFSPPRSFDNEPTMCVRPRGEESIGPFATLRK